MTRILGSVAALALALTGCSIPLTSDTQPRTPTRTSSPATTTATAPSTPAPETIAPTAAATPLTVGNCTTPTSAERKRVAEMVRDLGYAGRITRTAAVRFGDYAVIATRIADSPTAPGHPAKTRKTTWLASPKEGGVGVVEVADRWHSISDEVQVPGRKAQKRALACIG